MSIWVCQYILECVDGIVTGITTASLISSWVLYTGVLTLLVIIREPKTSGRDTPTPFGVILLAAVMGSAIVVAAMYLVFVVALNFTSGLVFIFGSSIFTLFLIILSIIIRNKKWK